MKRKLLAALMALSLVMSAYQCSENELAKAQRILTIVKIGHAAAVGAAPFLPPQAGVVISLVGRAIRIAEDALQKGDAARALDALKDAQRGLGDLSQMEFHGEEGTESANLDWREWREWCDENKKFLKKK